MNVTGPDSTGPAPDYYIFSSLAALETAFQSGGSLYRKLPRAVLCHADATLVITKVSGQNAGQTIAWFCKADIREDVQFGGFTASGSSGASISASAPIKVYL